MTRYKLKTAGHSHMMILQNNNLILAVSETIGNSQKFHRHQVREKANAVRQHYQLSDQSVNQMFLLFLTTDFLKLDNYSTAKLKNIISHPKH